MTLALDATGQVEHRLLWGNAVDQIFADENATGDVVWALTDHQNTVRDWVDPTGEVLNHIAYDSFGRKLSETDDTLDVLPLEYTGRYFDEATGLQWNHNRWYNSETGRWMSEDPIGFMAGDANLSRYVGNGPVNATDPTGLSIVRRTIPKESGENGKFSVDWKFELSDPYTFLVAVVQRIEVKWRVSNKEPLPESARRKTYYEIIGFIRPGEREISGDRGFADVIKSIKFRDGSAIIDRPIGARTEIDDTWSSQGFTEPTCGEIVVTGEVRVFRVNSAFLTAVKGWKPIGANTAAKAAPFISGSFLGFPLQQGKNSHFWNAEGPRGHLESSSTVLRATWGIKEPKVVLSHS